MSVCTRVQTCLFQISFCPVIASLGNRSQRTDSSFTAGCPAATPRAVPGSSGLARAMGLISVSIFVEVFRASESFISPFQMPLHTKLLLCLLWERFLFRGCKVCQNGKRWVGVIFQSLNTVSRSLWGLTMTCIRGRVRGRLTTDDKERHQLPVDVSDPQVLLLGWFCSQISSPF